MEAGTWTKLLVACYLTEFAARSGELKDIDTRDSPTDFSAVQFQFIQR
jgi:hypothetical protein